MQAPKKPFYVGFKSFFLKFKKKKKKKKLLKKKKLRKKLEMSSSSDDEARNKNINMSSLSMYEKLPIGLSYNKDNKKLVPEIDTNIKAINLEQNLSNERNKHIKEYINEDNNNSQNIRSIESENKEYINSSANIFTNTFNKSSSNIKGYLSDIEIKKDNNLSYISRVKSIPTVSDIYRLPINTTNYTDDISDNDTDDVDTLYQYLKNPKLKSSKVIPIKLQNKRNNLLQKYDEHTDNDDDELLAVKKHNRLSLSSDSSSSISTSSSSDNDDDDSFEFYRTTSVNTIMKLSKNRKLKAKEFELKKIIIN